MDNETKSNNDDESSSKLLTHRSHEYNPDDTINDADDDFEGEELLAGMSKGRGMVLEYSKIVNLPDYPAAKKYMEENMPTYKWRYAREGLAGVKQYYKCIGYKLCSKIVFIHLHCDSFECSVYQSSEDHQHVDHPNKIPQQMPQRKHY